jgi:hypothetical protein
LTIEKPPLKLQGKHHLHRGGENASHPSDLILGDPAASAHSPNCEFRETLSAVNTQATNKQKNSRKVAKAQRFLRNELSTGYYSRRRPICRISLASLRLCVRLILHFESLHPNELVGSPVRNKKPPRRAKHGQCSVEAAVVTR